MKNYLKWVVSIFILAIAMNITGIAEAKEWPEETGVSVTKPWTITCNQEVDASEISHNDIYILDNEGKSVGLYINEGSSPNQIKITPRTGYDQSSTKYTLYIEPFESKSGVMLNLNI